MDEVKKRLQETSEECFKCYEAWSKDHKDDKARESLQESIHELRRIASRLEIEVAVSERSEVTQKPIPIPPHRDAQRRMPDGNQADGNAGHIGSGGGKPRSGGRKRSPGGGGKKPSGGGGGNR